MTEYVLSKEALGFLFLCLVFILAYLLLKVFLPKFLLKATERLKTEAGLKNDLKAYISTFLDVIFFLLIFNLILSLPLIAKYVQPISEFSLLNAETLRITSASVVKGAIVFYLSLLVTKIIRKIIQIYLYYQSKGEDVVSTIDILVYNTALVVIILTTLSIIGISWKLLLPVAGALGIGLGFGLQDIANNFISGFVILMAKTVKRGDWITLGENFGKIEDIGIRTSTLRTIDNIDIIIPNSQIISNQLINWSYSDNIVRIHIPVGVSYSSDVNRVKDVLVEVARKSPDILNDRQIEARFLAFGDSSLDFELLGWIDIKKSAILAVKSNLNYMIWEAFKEKGIQIPFPQRDVWFRNELKVDGKSET